jgi:S1-C subfamily serine protease
MNYKTILKTSAPIIFGGLLFLSSQAIGVDVKLNPIKPNSTKPITDEQQAILAVRKAKASVVNIVGNKSGQNPDTQNLEASSVSGTGFIFSPDGYIVTNEHVVDDQANTYSVVFADGTTKPATILGRDKFNDVALVKIEDTSLVAAALGNSEGLETGQTVFAIGNSLGKYQNTVTRGVVSGIGRAVNIGTQDAPKPRLQNLIQTDASINPGNSGGPLINLAGEVIGMNTVQEVGAEGVGFAVPINTIKESVQQLKTIGKVSRPFLGLTYATITPIIHDVNKLASSEGAVVINVQPGSPADVAGIKYGDIVTAINHGIYYMARKFFPKDLEIFTHVLENK